MSRRGRTFMAASRSGWPVQPVHLTLSLPPEPMGRRLGQT